ncbi:helix-turn-helix domain-containing protein [Paraburkholderia sediminicola]|uniref:helix-turn-helix domain-containing protein n=1 Tax=Paraburkholderia sediminicola TaxID=458836 RepID=UPI0038B96D3A
MNDAGGEWQSRSMQTSIDARSLGNLVSAVGTPKFIPAFRAFLEGIVPSNAVHLACVRTRSPQTASGDVVEWLGSAGVDTYESYMPLYFERYYERDPTVPIMLASRGIRLSQKDIDSIKDDEFRYAMYEHIGIRYECSITFGVRNMHYSITLVRGKGDPRFSLSELERFRQLGEFLFPLLTLHARTGCAKQYAPSSEAIAGTRLGNPNFDERLVLCAVDLSSREREICQLILGGATLRESSERLQVKITTAETYVKRAFAKLGIRTKRELFAWAQTED